MILSSYHPKQAENIAIFMVAMCAARLNEPEIALQALLKNVQKNTYLINGHNYQRERLRIYLPGNGGFLKAVSLMCAGWSQN